MKKEILHECTDYLLEGEMSGDIIYLHFKWLGDAFTRASYNRLLSVYDALRIDAREAGVEEFRSVILNTDNKARKWQGLFGLTPIQHLENYTIYGMEI